MIRKLFVRSAYKIDNALFVMPQRFYYVFALDSYKYISSAAVFRVPFVLKGKGEKLTEQPSRMFRLCYFPSLFLLK